MMRYIYSRDNHGTQDEWLQIAYARGEAARLGLASNEELLPCYRSQEDPAPTMMEYYPIARSVGAKNTPTTTRLFKLMVASVM